MEFSTKYEIWSEADSKFFLHAEVDNEDEARKLCKQIRRADLSSLYDNLEICKVTREKVPE